MRSLKSFCLILAALLLPALGYGLTYDLYGGIATVNCTNPNGSSYFGRAQVGNHLVLCDPLNHPFFLRGFYVFDDATLGNDEAGGNYNSYITAKFGATNTTYTWVTQEIARFEAWGFNAIGPYMSAYALPMWPWTGGPPTNPTKIPFVYLEEACLYSWSNANGWGTAPVKDLMGVRSPFWTGYVPSSGETDYEDPAWTAFIQGEMSSSGDNVYATIIGASTSDKRYLVGIAGCDSDNTHGWGAGPDYDTQPAGQNDWRLSYAIALASPVSWASTRQSQIYTDSSVYSKKTWHDQLVATYGTIGNLNSAWGSTYGTFGSGGSCWGPDFKTWICPSAGSADSVGTGNGSTLTFSTTLTHSGYSVSSLGIFVAGVLVGGDPNTGTTIWGPHMTGTISGSSVSLTFASGHAPASGAAITAEYMTGAYGQGAGLMDEDGRVSHQGWTGTNPICPDGVGTTAACAAGGGAPYASAGMAADLNTLDVTLAAHFASTYQATIHTNLPGALFWGPTTLGGWSAPPNRYTIEGMAPYTDVIQGGTLNAWTQSMLDFIHTYTVAAGAPDLAISYAAYTAANLDSPFAWPGSSCTHVSSSVTCTVASPKNFSTGALIKASCLDSTYNVSQVFPTSVGSSTVVYTAAGSPASGSTTCDVAFDDTQVGGFATQASRGSDVAGIMTGLPSTAYTADGRHPYVSALWWQWADKQDEELGWGVVDTRDNAYNGVETTVSSISCAAPISLYPCGSELRGGWGSDNLIGPLITANSSIDLAVSTYGFSLPATILLSQGEANSLVK